MVVCARGFLAKMSEHITVWAMLVCTKNITFLLKSAMRFETARTKMGGLCGGLCTPPALILSTFLLYYTLTAQT